jgi:hypothetical protein
MLSFALVQHSVFRTTFCCTVTSLRCGAAGRVYTVAAAAAAAAWPSCHHKRGDDGF